MEQTWQDYGIDEGDVYVITSYFQWDWSSGEAVPGNVPWDDLNGGTWRTAFDPPLTLYLSSIEDGMFQYQYDDPENPINFGVGGSPTNVIISPDNEVLFNSSGYSLPYHLSHVAIINNNLGLHHPQNLTGTPSENNVIVSWTFTPQSETYTFHHYTIYRNGENVAEIDNAAILGYIDEGLENGVYNYQISVTYEKNDNSNVLVESLISEATESIQIGDLGDGEWLSYGTNFGNAGLGVSRTFAYAVEFDLGDTEYEVRAIEVAHEVNGSVDWAIVDFGDGLVKGPTDDDMLGNDIFEGLSGTINTIVGYEHCMSVFNCDTRISGHIAVVVTAEANDANYAYEDNPLADWFTEVYEDEWQHLTYFDDGSGTFYGTWFLRIFVVEPATGTEYELTPSGLVKLGDNFPNPFNPSTTISYELNDGQNGKAQLEIFNTKGQKVKVLPITNYNPGINEVVWDGTDDHNNEVTSGVYFYKLKTDKGYTKTKKMIMIK